jgi:pimeloyl-ACP methyl ester carboxylesterase
MDLDTIRQKLLRKVVLKEPHPFDMAEEIRNISQPTLIIWGREDKALPAEMAERFRQDIKNAVVKIIPNCGHNPQEERPEEVNELIKQFAGS